MRNPELQEADCTFCFKLSCCPSFASSCIETKTLKKIFVLLRSAGGLAPVHKADKELDLELIINFLISKMDGNCSEVIEVPTTGDWLAHLGGTTVELI